MRKLFGTDGIRGQANRYPIEAQTALKVGAAVGYRLLRSHESPLVLIGRDTRASGSMLEAALAAGLCSAGVNVQSLGVISTPGVACLTRKTPEAAAGIVISASHNPFLDNGIKIFAHDGFKLPDAEEIEIEELIAKDFAELLAAPHAVGALGERKDALNFYLDDLAQALPTGSLAGLKIVLDAANGAATQAAPELFRRLGAEVTAIGVAPDGTNINKGCGSLHTEALQETVRAQKAQFGVAFDGDADRAIFVSESGEVVDGDQVMALCALHLKKQGRLQDNTLVATVMSNLGLDRAMREAGITVVKTAVGDRYVVEHLREHGLSFGGEQSGHLIFMDHSTTGDGLLTAVLVAGLLRHEHAALSELAGVMHRYPQVLKNLIVNYKRPLETLGDAARVIAQAEESLGDEGRVLVRYSGTENKVRVMIEGPDEALIGRLAAEILHALDVELN